MVRTTHYPEYNISTSEHAFGEPGKNCKGMLDQDNTLAASNSGLTTATAIPDCIQETLETLVRAV